MKMKYATRIGLALLGLYTLIVPGVGAIGNEEPLKPDHLFDNCYLVSSQVSPQGTVMDIYMCGGRDDGLESIGTMSGVAEITQDGWLRRTAPFNYMLTDGETGFEYADPYMDGWNGNEELERVIDLETMEPEYEREPEPTGNQI